jgi:hypothetical protein
LPPAGNLEQQRQRKSQGKDQTQPSGFPDYSQKQAHDGSDDHPQQCNRDVSGA